MTTESGSPPRLMRTAATPTSVQATAAFTVLVITALAAWGLVAVPAIAFAAAGAGAGYSLSGSV